MGEEKKVHPFSGFSGIIKREHRLRRLLDIGAIQSFAAEMFRRHDISEHWGEKLVENFLGFFPLPIGVVCIPVNGEDRYVLYANEESSVVAAACKAGSIFRNHGISIETGSAEDHYSNGQILIVVPESRVREVKADIVEKKECLIELVNNEIAKKDLERGGGVKDIYIGKVVEGIYGNNFGICVHVLVDTGDAMGANKVTTICELIGSKLEEITGCETVIKILTNLVSKISYANVVLKNFDSEKGRRIEIASRLAECDEHRAATNTKGLMNSLVAVAKSSGNDDRAMSTAFFYHMRNMDALTATSWEMVEGNLHGRFSGSIDVGVVGGAISAHPIAQICLQIMKVKTAKELRELMAAAALAQNFAALLALTDQSKRFTEGHMKLHAKNLARQAGANDLEIGEVVRILKEELREHGISLSDAQRVLAQVQKNNS